MKISVVLAAYKGEKYLGEQLSSVLPQLGPDDELIISDDLPDGETKKIVDSFAAGDSRIKYIEGKGEGVCKNFENAINTATGDIIFLSDQDDVWLPKKVETVMREFDKGATVVLHDAKVTDAFLKITSPSYFDVHGTKAGFLNNLIRNSFVGCCMAFTGDFKKTILPFPDDLPMHDWWIGLLGELKGTVSFVHETLILYRRHPDTVTGKMTSTGKKFLWRAEMLFFITERVLSKKKNRGAK